MSDENANGAARRELLELDEELSAYVDGELSPEAAARIEALAAQRSDVGERIERLRAAADALRALPGAIVAPDLRTRLQARIAEDTSASARRDGTAGVASLAQARARRSRWLLPAASAIAAGLAIYFAVGIAGDDETGAGGTGGRLPTNEPVVAQTPDGPGTPDELPAPDAPRIASDGGEPGPGPDAPLEPDTPSDSPVAPSQLVAEDRVAPDSAVSDGSRLAVVDGPEVLPALPEEPRLELGGESLEASELAIALDLDALADFEVIDQLELLEALAALDDREVRS